MRLQFFKVCNMFTEGKAVHHFPRNQSLDMHGFKLKNFVSFIIITIFQKRIRIVFHMNCARPFPSHCVLSK